MKLNPFSKEKMVVAYAVEKCSKCGLIKKRKFRPGDVLYGTAGNCSSCDGPAVIEKIYGEILE